jgi:hypothetical protein
MQLLLLNAAVQLAFLIKIQPSKLMGIAKCAIFTLVRYFINLLSAQMVKVGKLTGSSHQNSFTYKELHMGIVNFWQIGFTPASFEE